MAKRERPEVPEEMVERVRAITDTLPEVYEEDAWVGLRWRVGGATVAHLFGGEDQQFRIVLHGQSGDVAAFEHLGHPYFRAGWGADVIAAGDVPLCRPCWPSRRRVPVRDWS